MELQALEAALPAFHDLGARLVAISPQNNVNSRKSVNDPAWVLPMPARFVMGQDGVIIYAQVNPDYTQRPDPSELLPALRG